MDGFARLQWRCRRGIREMDLLLEGFLHSHYSNLSDEEKNIFDSLLDETDPDLMNWIMGRTEPENPAYLPVLAKLRSMDTDKNAD